MRKNKTYKYSDFNRQQKIKAKKQEEFNQKALPIILDKLPKYK